MSIFPPCAAYRSNMLDRTVVPVTSSPKGGSQAMSNLFDLTCRVAVVSGAAQGIGRAMALALGEAGADLVLADLNTAGVGQTAEHIAGLGRRALPLTCDVSVPMIPHFKSFFAHSGESAALELNARAKHKAMTLFIVVLLNRKAAKNAKQDAKHSV